MLQETGSARNAIALLLIIDTFQGKCKHYDIKCFICGAASFTQEEVQVCYIHLLTCASTRTVRTLCTCTILLNWDRKAQGWIYFKCVKQSLQFLKCLKCSILSRNEEKLHKEGDLNFPFNVDFFSQDVFLIKVKYVKQQRKWWKRNVRINLQIARHLMSVYTLRACNNCSQRQHKTIAKFSCFFSEKYLQRNKSYKMPAGCVTYTPSAHAQQFSALG